MDRLQKKCLIASFSAHAFLLVLLLAGTAFIVPAKKTVEMQALRVVPTRLIDQAMSGGGGNPNIAPNQGQQKGTMQPLPPLPMPPPKRADTPPPPPPPTPPKTQKTDTRKTETLPPAKKNDRTPRDTRKQDTLSTTSTTPLANLRRVERTRADAEAARRDAEQAAAAQARAAEGRRLASQLGRVMDNLRAGFEQGTVVEVSGPGGEAYASYASFVESVFKDAWIPPDDVDDEYSTVKAVVTITRSGHVILKRIDAYSRISSLDRSVQRALDKVKFVAPFPEGAKDDQRVFIINFNLKSKRSFG